jgi:hypothetical protein
MPLLAYSMFIFLLLLLVWTAEFTWKGKANKIGHYLSVLAVRAVHEVLMEADDVFR